MARRVGEGDAPELACLYCAETGCRSGRPGVPKISPNVSVQAHEPTAIRWRALFLARQIAHSIAGRPLVLPSPNLPFYGLHVRLDELAAHHRARCDRGRRRLREPKTAVELMPVLFRRPLDRHQTAFALGEALAHLHYLMGKAKSPACSGADGVYRFVRAEGCCGRQNGSGRRYDDDRLGVS